MAIDWKKPIKHAGGSPARLLGEINGGRTKVLAVAWDQSRGGREESLWQIGENDDSSLFVNVPEPEPPPLPDFATFAADYGVRESQIRHGGSWDGLAHHFQGLGKAVPAYMDEIRKRSGVK